MTRGGQREYQLSYETQQMTMSATAPSHIWLNSAGSYKPADPLAKPEAEKKPRKGFWDMLLDWSNSFELQEEAGYLKQQIEYYSY